MSISLKKSNLLECLHVSVKGDSDKGYKYFICNWLCILTVIAVGKSKFWILTFWTRTLPADSHWLMIPSSEIWATESFRLQEHFKLNLCVLPSSLNSLFHCVTFAYKRRLETITGGYFSCFLVAHWHNIWKKLWFWARNFIRWKWSLWSYMKNHPCTLENCMSLPLLFVQEDWRKESCDTSSRNSCARDISSLGKQVKHRSPQKILGFCWIYSKKILLLRHFKVGILGYRGYRLPALSFLCGSLPLENPFLQFQRQSSPSSSGMQSTLTL